MRAFSFLEKDLTYQRITTEYDSARFGNAIVEYRSPRLRIRVTKDRGQYVCDFAAPRGPAEWFDQDIVFRDLGEDHAVDEVVIQRWSSLDAVAASVKEAIERIAHLFTDERYLASRARFQNGQLRRVQKLFGDSVAGQIGGKTRGEGGG